MDFCLRVLDFYLLYRYNQNKQVLSFHQLKSLMTSPQQIKSLTHFCQREDLTTLRQDILVDYRHRISAGKRTKLTSDERQTLINWFIETLKAIDNEADIQALCEAEITLLEEGYPKSTIASDILAKYRHALEQSLNNGDLLLTDNNSHHYTYTKRHTGEEVQGHEHYALTYLKYDQQTYKTLRNQGTAINNERQDNLQPVPVHRYLDQIQKLIQTKDQHRLEYKLAIAIAGATGRRHTEVLSLGHFTLTGHPYLLHFEGQQKKKEGEPTSFDILTILPATQVIQAIIQFRQLPAVAKLQDLNSQSNEVKSFNVQVNRLVQKLFQETGIVPVIPGKNYVSVHRLRGVYGAIAVHFFCPQFRHEHRFLQNDLGHVLDEQVAPNSPATAHYFHYYLVDFEGNRLGDKGVKLAEFPFPDHPDYTDKSITNLIDSELDHQLQESLKTALSQMLGSDSYTVLLAALMAVTGRSPGELIKSGTFEASDHPFTVTFSPTGLGAKSTLKTLIDASVVLESLDQLREHPELQDLRYQTPSYIDNHCLPYITQAIHTHLPFDDVNGLIDFYLQITGDYTDKSPLSSPSSEQPLPTTLDPMISQTLHHQSQTIALLTQQLALRDTKPIETHPQADNQDYEREIQQLQEQLSQLQKQNDSLSQQITQLKARVYDFEQENQHLKQTVSRFEVIKQAVLGEQLELPINTDTTPNKTPQKTKTKTKGKKTRKTRGPKGAAKAKAKKVLEAIAQWNQQHPDHTWAINTYLLEAHFGINRKAGSEFQQEHQSLIDQLHSDSNVTNPQTHNRGKDPNSLKTFVMPFLNQ